MRNLGDPAKKAGMYFWQTVAALNEALNVYANASADTCGGPWRKKSTGDSNSVCKRLSRENPSVSALKEMLILNVAEKPSVAKEVSRILSRGSCQMTASCSQFNRNWEFQYDLDFQRMGRCTMIFTSVTGHLMETDFNDNYRSWHSCPPADLYHAIVVKRIPDSKTDIRRNLEQQARRCNMLILWLDCDREGENIAFEVVDVCVQANPNMFIKRAKFSALIERDLQWAINNLVDPNRNESLAVDARQEIDLRAGASFTRFQTLLLQSRFDWGIAENERGPLLSYGPCQFPTLGLIVQREWDIKAHIMEDFWYIHVTYAPGNKSDDGSCEFHWVRGKLFDKFIAVALFQLCVEQPEATVLKVDGREKSRWAPCPLSTLEMQKKGTQSLRIPGERIMKIAEELYQQGFISYPRTETDVFPKNFDFMSLVRDQSADPNWGPHAQKILDGSMWRFPRNGGHDDKAHPPIHPTRYAPNPAWEPNKKKLYEFIVRSFLACCSKDALGHETSVEIDIAGERFTTKGLMILEKNWLEVYPYTTWGGNDNLPQFQLGQKFFPNELRMKEGKTEPPPRLKEKDLIAKMEEYGIGTDATVAEHIQKQLDRQYAEKNHLMEFSPTPLGEGLITAYCNMGLDGLWKPDLRGRIEAGIRDIAEGQKTKEEVLGQAIEAFRNDFVAAQQSSGVMVDSMGRFYPPLGGAQNNNAQGQDAIGPCPRCGLPLSLTRDGLRAKVACGGNPACDFGIKFPSCVSGASIEDRFCESCTHGQVRVIKLDLRMGDLPLNALGLFESPTHIGCAICDGLITVLLEETHASRRMGRTGGDFRGRGGFQGGGGRGGGGWAQNRGRIATRAPAARGAGRGRAAGRARGQGANRGGNRGVFRARRRGRARARGRGRRGRSSDR